MRPLIAATAVLALVVAACGSGSDGSGITTTTTGATTTTTTPVTTTTGTDSTTTTMVGNPCSEEGSDPIAFDLDGDGVDESVFLAADASSSRLGVCVDGGLAESLTIDRADLAVLGFVDLDDDGTHEILLRGTGDDGDVMLAATVTMRGLALTDVVVERWIDTDPPIGPFTASGIECGDADRDGDLELLTVAYWPATGFAEDPALDDRVHIGVAVIGLDGTTAVSYGIDAYETDFASAYARWSEPDRCAPGSSPRVEVRWSDNGWGRVGSDPSTFASDGSVVLTGIARGGSDDRYVAVGTEQPNLLLGEWFESRPVIWSSTDALIWEKADLGDATGELRDVVALTDGAGFVAVGRTGLLSAAAWVSTEGRTWDPVEVPQTRSGPGLEGPVMSQVITTPLGIVAVGFEDFAPDDGARGVDLDAAVWLSPDGRTWERIEDRSLGTAGYQPNSDGEFNAVLVGVAYRPDVGLVAVGWASEEDPLVDYPPRRPAAWVSPDGRAWERHIIDADARLRGVTSTADGLVAFGVSDVNGSPTSDAVVLHSPDGTVWTPAVGEFTGIGEVDGIQSINGAIPIPDIGLVAFGADEIELETMGGAAVWWSDPTGSTWRREIHDDAVFSALDDAPTATMTDAVWSDGVLVTVGFSGRWTNPDYGPQGCCLVGPAIWLWAAS